MTDTELAAFIRRVPAAKSLAEQGCDAGIPALLRAEPDWPHVAKRYDLTRKKLLDLLGPLRGAAVLTAMLAVAADANHVLQPVLSQLLPLLDGEGLNLGHRDAPALLTALAAQQLLTAEEAEELRALAEELEPVTTADVSRALSPYRVNHQVGPMPAD